MKQQPTNWRTLLNRWISGEADRNDERSLEALAQDDPFLADALEGYRSVPEADHARSVTRLKANLRKRNKKKDRAIVFYLKRIAAVGVLMLGAWLVFRAFDGSENKTMGFDERSEGIHEKATNGNTAAVPIIQDSSTSGKEEEYVVNFNDAEKEPSGINRDLIVTEAATAVQDAPPAVRVLPPATTNDNFNISKKDAVAQAKEGTPDKRSQAISATEAKAKLEAEAKNELAEGSKKKVEEEAKKKLEAPDLYYNQEAPKPATPAKVAEDADVAFDVVENTADENIVTNPQSIKGQVTDANGNPLIGASVLINSTSQGAVTGIDGSFSINSPHSNPSLTVAYTGYHSQEILVSGNDFLHIQLSEDMALDEVVVTGLAQKNKSKQPDFEPKGGLKKFEKYIKENLRKPQAAIDAGVSGQVEIGFTINASGQPSGIKILRSLGHGCDEEAIRLLQDGPKWNGQPGIQHSHIFEF